MPVIPGMTRRTCTREDTVANDKHAHNWVIDQDIMNISRKGKHGTRYYHCSGCPLTKTENY